MDNWENYKLILALHREGTIRGAAKTMAVNHATISRRLAHINSLAKTPIFEKIAGGYKITDIGLEHVTAAEQIELITLKAERRSRAINANLSGTIRISMGEPLAQLLLHDDLFDFINEHPNIDLTVETSVNMMDLDRSEADIVVRGTMTPPQHLVGRRLFPFYLCDYCSTDYLEKTPYENRQWLRYSKSIMEIDWIKNSCHPEASIGLESDDLMFLLRAAESGYGMIRTACYMADNNPNLIRLPNAEPIEAQDLWVLTHPDLRRTKRIQYIMKHISSALEAKKPLIQGQTV